MGDRDVIVGDLEESPVKKTRFQFLNHSARSNRTRMRESNSRRGGKASVAVVSVAAVVTSLTISSPANAAQPQRVVDRAIVECSSDSLLEVDLERERRVLEVDVSMYTEARERWTLTIAQRGQTLHTFDRTANREGELDTWRKVPLRDGVIVVNARSASGETCVARVRN